MAPAHAAMLQQTHATLRTISRRLARGSLTPGFSRHAERLLPDPHGQHRGACAQSGRLPPFLRNSGMGWVTAEPACCSRATHTRGKQSGRSQEIRRLIGRAMRCSRLAYRTSTFEIVAGRFPERPSAPRATARRRRINTSHIMEN